MRKTRKPKAAKQTAAERKRAAERFLDSLPPNIPRPALSGASDAHMERCDLTDAGNAALLIKLAGGSLRAVVTAARGGIKREWIHWNGERWRHDTDGTIMRRAAEAAAEHYLRQAREMNAKVEAGEIADDDVKAAKELAKSYRKWATYCRSARGQNAMVLLAQTQPGVAIEAAKLDTKRHLFGAANGVVNLKTGELAPAAREDLVTCYSPVRYVPGAACERWTRFIAEVSASSCTVKRDGKVIEQSFAERPALAAYHQRRLGYVLTGEVREELMFNDHGPGGANGKNTMFDAVRHVLGPLTCEVNATLLQPSRFAAANAEGATPGLARLRGKRLAWVAEWPEDTEVDPAKIKRLTGEPVLTARELFQSGGEFPVLFKLVVASNAMMKYEHLDAATRGRIHVVPWSVSWNRPGEQSHNAAKPDGDKELKAALREPQALEGILAWMVAGAVAYYREGLAAPGEVRLETQALFAAHDHIAHWLATVERCAPETGGTYAKEARDACIQWCERSGVHGGFTIHRFAAAMKAAGVPSHIDMHGTRYGIRAAPEYSSPRQGGNSAARG